MNKLQYYKNRLRKVIRDKDEILKSPYKQKNYLKWLSQRDEISEVLPLSYQPSFSFVIPVYNVNRIYLTKCLDSILAQTYDNFEICLVDDCSTNEDTIHVLQEYSEKDKVKVKYRELNGHISNATNDALAMATGEFICMMDNDDTLEKNALYECALALNRDKNIDFIYTDEDKCDENDVRSMPHFKPDYSPDLLLSTNYMCHFTVVRKSLVEKVNGFTVGLEGAQDHDLFLKVCENTNHVYHIPKVLYHWRMIEGSTSLDMNSKDYVVERGIQTVRNALMRRNLKGSVQQTCNTTNYLIDFDIDDSISMDIFVKGNKETVLKSLETQTFKNFRIVEDIADGTGSLICILDDSIEFKDPEALHAMVGYALLNHIGVVSCKQVYKKKVVQAGILLGMADDLFTEAFKGSMEDEEVIFGALSIPYNYSCVSNCIILKRRLLNKDINFNLRDYLEIDICLDLLRKGYYNVCLPYVKVIKHPKEINNVAERNYLYTKYREYFVRDPYYNENFSKKNPYKLDI